MRLILVAFLVALIGAAFAISACDGFGGVDPVETVCAICDLVQESGICEIVQSLESEKCTEGQRLVFTNLKEALKQGVALETACR